MYGTIISPQTTYGEILKILFSAAVLSILTVARPYLITRVQAMREFREPYVLTYRALGYSPGLIRRHVRRNTVIPTMTDSVLNFGWILTAQVFLELIMKIDGMGYILFSGTVHGNPFLIQIAIIYFAVVMIGASILTDILIYFADPRVRR